jgi:hypothetical protein
MGLNSSQTGHSPLPHSDGERHLESAAFFQVKETVIVPSNMHGPTDDHGHGCSALFAAAHLLYQSCVWWRTSCR